MDVYGLSSPDLLPIDDLLDFSNGEIFSSSSTIVSSATSSASSSSENPFNFPSPASTSFHTSPPPLTDFAHDLCVPSDDAAHLEWLSRFVDDSFSDYPANPLTMTVKPEMSFTGKPRSRRSRATAPSTWVPTPEAELCHPSQNVRPPRNSKRRREAEREGARTARRRKRLSGGRDRSGLKRFATPVEFVSNQGGLCRSTDLRRSDDAAHLEWLSRFVDDSFSDYPANPLTMTVKPEMSFTGKPRSRRSRATAPSTWVPTPEAELCHSVAKRKTTKKLEAAERGGARRCTHCASEKTPQWRTGPLGPKTLCNACGVRFKSGRLVPEYRPASSPTFVLTQHSNSHRKVMELRRQKEQLESAVHLLPFQPQ
ncbi:hypothetical protein Bca52824_082541 [Brassica carinata]|uniref:GATA transcription factor n=1 Tax=Brassica carinata TaxID=52824 RepID=A0A8X7TS05_BRACI|nr:hypothetical protein Bca52824_082541 [Brassica carinata]